MKRCAQPLRVQLDWIRNRKQTVEVQLRLRVGHSAARAIPQRARRSTNTGIQCRAFDAERDERACPCGADCIYELAHCICVYELALHLLTPRARPYQLY
jgi:hypothetical protein